jgi:hypothetical protein
MTYQQLLLLLSGAVAARAAVATVRAFSGARFNRGIRSDAARLPTYLHLYDVADGASVQPLFVVDDCGTGVERSVPVGR